MSRYIDLDSNDCVWCGNPGEYENWNVPLDMPGADVAPVVHGHWKGYRFPKYRGNDDFGEPIFKEYVAYTCSNCRKQNAIRHKYCPMCGAIMDEVTE